MAEALRLLLCLVVALAGAGVRPALGGQAVAIVTDVRGEARLADGSVIELLRGLPAGAEVRLQASAQIVLVHLDAQSTYALTGPGAYAIRAREVAALDAGRVAAPRALPAAFRGVRLDPARIAQASIAMRGEQGRQGVRLISPVATWLLASPRMLRWERPVQAPQSEFRVQLTDAENRTLFETRTRATEIELPAGITLAPGQLYGWQVQTAPADGGSLEGWSEFGLADDALRARASAARPPQNAADAERIAYALLLEALGLREAAQAQWADAARARPHEARLRALAEDR